MVRGWKGEVYRRRWSLTETGRGVDENLDGTREYLPVSAKGAGRSYLDTREAIKPMTPPLAWREAGPLASANSASTKYTEGHRYWPYCASTRLRGIQVHSTRTRQRHGLFFPFQAPCLVQVLLLLHMSAANTISSCKPGAHHRFLMFLLLLFLRHAHPWKCDAKIPLATDASMPHAACGSRQKSVMHGRHQSASWCAWPDWSPQQARNPTRSVA